MDYKKLYLENREFRAYVDKCRRPGKSYADVELDDFLARKTVKDVGDYFASKPESEQNHGFPGLLKEEIECDCKSC